MGAAPPPGMRAVAFSCLAAWREQVPIATAAKQRDEGRGSK
ncbi:hypothetical protein FHU38_000044 [Saccharomonospora amisosensis]|uniref:Uncharacterized protein n=2 Tax=Saccharomonospora TaxID=1851 RepID=H5X749_9PSEU|nr:hypothetical protein SacmaDRAFT_5386 [Saccharomonospora marina XMU15]NIJ09700.1 hypothetical protein [Saccharomonospora amisosensis]